jgi:hypothetical protein
MASRWPYVLALVFVVAGIAMTMYAPIAATIYGCVPALAFAAYRAFAWRSPFRVPLAVAMGLMGAGLLAFLFLLLIGWAAGASMIMDTVVGLIGFAGILALPMMGALIALVALVGAMARPGTAPVRIPYEPVGEIG